MTQVYDILDKIRKELQDNTIIRLVSYGSIEDVDLDKTSNYPLAHIIIDSAAIYSNYVTFNLNLIFADLVKINKKGDNKGAFYGNDNLQDVQNAMFQVANQLTAKMMRGDLRVERIQIDEVVGLTPFKERFADEVAGWEVNMTINMQNDISIC